jgi:arginyl-tRNA--protein-N-Asp/Glu arginylyltransferase
MINGIHFPLKMDGKELDSYLERGWFRMGPTIFTTDMIPMNGELYRVYWLRIRIAAMKFGKAQQRLFRINQDLGVEFRKFVLNDEIESLYSKYRETVTFDASESVAMYLLNGISENVYDSHVIEIRDKDKLIAVGIFDDGAGSMAGIINFYDPEYSSRSLGKYLMLLKGQYAKDHGKQFYYPGYIATGFTKFDYKLWMDREASEIYDAAQQQWVRAEMLPWLDERNANGQDRGLL